MTRVITDAQGVETRLADAVAAMKAAGVDGDPQMGSKSIGDGKVVLQVSVEGADARLMRRIVDDHLAASASLVTEAREAPLRLFVSDMDSTMIGQECIDELADFADLKDRVAAITEQAMRGELDFEQALRERVGLLAGLPESAIAECLEQRITPMAGARTLVQTLRAHRCRTVLVTGGFHHFADAVAGQLGFDRVVGNRLEVADGKLTGGLTGAIADSSTKLAVLEEERAALANGSVLATGDGANDIPMIEAADYGFAYRAKPKARDVANGRVDEGDLTAILHLLDIPRQSWVTD